MLSQSFACLQSQQTHCFVSKVCCHTAVESAPFMVTPALKHCVTTPSLSFSQYVAMQGCTTCNKQQCAEARQELLRLREERATLNDKLQTSSLELQDMQAENAILKQQAQVNCLYTWYQKLPCVHSANAVLVESNDLTFGARVSKV